MPGNTIIVAYGKAQAEGNLVGMSVLEARSLFVKAMLDQGLPQTNLPLDPVAEIATMDPEDPVWQAIASKQTDVLVAAPTDKGARICQAVAKVVPLDYVIRPADVFLKFSDPAKTP